MYITTLQPNTVGVVFNVPADAMNKRLRHLINGTPIDVIIITYTQNLMQEQKIKT